MLTGRSTVNVQTPPAATVEARSDRLAARLAELELDSLLVTDLLNVRYLTGFTGTNGACIVTRTNALFVTDFRYVEQAEAQVVGYERIAAGATCSASWPGACAGAPASRTRT